METLMTDNLIEAALLLLGAALALWVFKALLGL